MSKASKWRRIYHDGEKLQDVGILADGSLHNPNGYPDDKVRAAIHGAEQRQHERRSKAAKKAAETRQRRKEKEVYKICKLLLSGGILQPANNCRICGRAVDDQDSQARGIGSDCWQWVLSSLEQMKEETTNA